MNFGGQPPQNHTPTIARCKCQNVQAKRFILYRGDSVIEMESELNTIYQFFSTIKKTKPCEVTLTIITCHCPPILAALFMSNKII
jgi:hypothetical protein